MARRSIPIEEKIETQKELVSRAKDRYEAELVCSLVAYEIDVATVTLAVCIGHAVGQGDVARNVNRREVRADIAAQCRQLCHTVLDQVAAGLELVADAVSVGVHEVVRHNDAAGVGGQVRIGTVGQQTDRKRVNRRLIKEFCNLLHRFL